MVENERRRRRRRRRETETWAEAAKMADGAGPSWTDPKRCDGAAIFINKSWGNVARHFFNKVPFPVFGINGVHWGRELS